LAMIYNGAGGATQRAMEKVLELQDLEMEDVNGGNAALAAALKKQSDGLQLAIANALWVDHDIKLDPAFTQRCQEFYAAQASSVDLRDPTTLDKINKWVSQKTDQKIDSLLNRADLANATSCILTSAIYFKGRWAKPFNKSATREGTFTLPGERRKNVPMMSQSGRYSYNQSAGFQAISLTYGDGKISMYIFVPCESSGLKDFLETLNASHWKKWMAEFQETQVELTLPRFQSLYETDLNEPLSNLSMRVAFSSNADFSPMGLGGHSITKVKHKALVEVNEEGTEAAAATAVIMTRSFLRPVRMTVNRPFFWAIRDNTSGLLLFLGMVVDPLAVQ
jgi:serine protease inhibitor